MHLPGEAGGKGSQQPRLHHAAPQIATNVPDQAMGRSLPLRGSYLPLLLEAFAAEYGTSLRRPERHCSLLGALRTYGSGFHFRSALAGLRDCTQHGNPFGLAGFATLRFVLELFIMEEQLLACGEDKIGSAVDTS
jgi:hypothetical protein